MNRPCRLVALFVCLWSVLPVVQALEEGVDRRDALIQADGRRIPTFVVRELLDEVEHRVQETMATVQTRRYRDSRGNLVGIVYHGMDGGFWQRARDYARNGDYHRAALNYKRLFESAGEVEWQRAYGLYGLGMMLQKLGQWEQAATVVFEAFIEEFPEHRLILNARYQAGVSYAMAGRLSDAETVIEGLRELSRGRAARAAELRMRAIEALVALGRGNFNEANRRQRSVRFTFDDKDQFIFGDKDIWLHWNTLWGECLTKEEQWEAAGRHYESLLEQIITDPERSADLLLTVAHIHLKAGNPDAALYRLLRFDALPIGGQNQRAEARILAAGILFDQTQALEEEARKGRLVAAQTMLTAVIRRSELPHELAVQSRELWNRLPGVEALPIPDPPTADATPEAAPIFSEGGDDDAGDDAEHR